MKRSDLRDKISASVHGLTSLQTLAVSPRTHFGGIRGTRKIHERKRLQGIPRRSLTFSIDFVSGHRERDNKESFACSRELRLSLLGTQWVDHLNLPEKVYTGVSLPPALGDHGRVSWGTGKWLSGKVLTTTV